MGYVYSGGTTGRERNDSQEDLERKLIALALTNAAVKAKVYSYKPKFFLPYGLILLRP